MGREENQPAESVIFGVTVICDGRTDNSPRAGRICRLRTCLKLPPPVIFGGRVGVGGNAVDLRSADRAAINQNTIAPSFRHPGTLFSPRLTGVVLAGVQCCGVANWIPACRNDAACRNDDSAQFY